MAWRDRDSTYSAKSYGGGVAIYRRDGGPMVSHLASATIAERCWCVYVVHVDTGPHLLCGWYRPGDQHIGVDFEKEWQKHITGMVGVSVVGDLNIHHQQWLKFSSGTTLDLDGEIMYQIAKQYKLKECVRAPTRDGHLLDLCLSSTLGAAARAF